MSCFYVPLMARAKTYDRMAGYFTSSALSLAAAGLARFIANDGVMRLIVGAQLDPDDVDAIERGEPLDAAVSQALLSSDAFSDPRSLVGEHRRNVLGWLVRKGRIEIKVGVPLDAQGRPRRPMDATRYFHSKYGIFTDGTDEADRVAFIGSDNETWSGWVGNHETFSAFPTWLPEVWENNGADLVAKFDAHWRDRPDEGWKVLDLDDAVRCELVKWAIGDAPPTALDPEDRTKRPIAAPPALTGAPDERLIELARAPRANGGSGVGLVTAGVLPLPHQDALVNRAVGTWPRGYLLADEVGLGKTIEAGFIIRELLLSGKAERFLILVPAAVLRQWQEELAEKLSLRVNRFEGGEFYDPENRAVPFSGSPWNAFPIVLASSHLARRRDRYNEVLASGPWDVVLCDEAHHARRQGGKANGTPNQLLKLLHGMRGGKACKALYLATATPMQMHPHEAWDLVELLGLPGQWSESSAQFIQYFDELREDWPRRQWTFLSRMARDFVKDRSIHLDQGLNQKMEEELTKVKSRRVRQVSTEGLTQSQARAVDEELHQWIDLWLLTNNPMRDRVFRNTRTTMRAYSNAGLLPPGTVIPDRQVSDEFVEMTSDERELYERIRTYIRRSYNRYMTGAKRNALGFIMTIYRRRLTSSFRAIELSLQRRMDTLEGKRMANELFDDDDLIADPTLPFEDLEKTPVQELEDELHELRSFLLALRDLPPDESKMHLLHEAIEQSFTSGHETVLVFTQYTDTMNYIVEQLSTVYGPRVMSYSGDGGRRRMSATTDEWVDVSKKETKNLFREGREIKVLVGTDALSEGLNLQTCARVINYDMPWNFMRVEQRIGRVDRINGKPTIEVTNLFYKDTIEEQIYRGISAGHDGFSWIVGPAQPVLAAIEEEIKKHEFGNDSDNPGPGIPDAPLSKIIDNLRIEIEKAQAQAITLSTFESRDAGPDDSKTVPVVRLEDIEETLLAVRATRAQFIEHPEIERAWIIADESGNKVPVTFDRCVLAENSPDIRLLTFADPLFNLVMRRAGVVIGDEERAAAQPAGASSNRVVTIAE
ncbi:MAG: DEAD/DEAH box helicase [Acidimicrobiales bacterium]